MTELQTENQSSTSQSTEITRCLPVSIENCVALYQSREKMVCGNSSYFVRFGFDDEWSTYPIKTAQFRYQEEDGKWVQQNVIFEGTDCPVPVIPYADTVYVGVYAGNITTSTEAAIPCRLSTLSFGSLPEPDDNDVYNQILQILNSSEYLSKDKVLPQLFGAVGDGITDDTAAFQALDGKNAYIPEGVYRVSRCVFRKNTVLRGAGVGKTIIMQIPDANSDLFVFENADNSCMSDISLQGTGANTEEALTSRKENCNALLKIVSTKERLTNEEEPHTVFHNITIRKAPYVGLMLVGSGNSTRDSAYRGISVQTTVPHMSQFTISQCGSWGMVDESTHSRFSSFTVSDNGPGGILLSHGESNLYDNFSVEGTADQWDNDGNEAHVTADQCTNLRFVHFNIDSDAGTGMKITQSSFIRGEGSICRMGDTPASEDEIGLMLADSTNSSFNLIFRHGDYPPVCNVKIDEGCESVEARIAYSSHTANENKCSDSCFIVEEWEAIEQAKKLSEKAEEISLGLAESLRHTPMSLTEAQQITSRENISAAGVIISSESGENITLSDADNHRLRGLRIFGKSTQEIPSGAQLAGFPDVPEVTVNGVTWWCSNGAIGVKGKKTTSTDAVSKDPSIGISASIPIEQGTYSFNGSRGVAVVYVEITKADGTVTVLKNGSGTFTLDGTELACLIYVTVESSIVVDVTLLPMVNKGTSSLPWEPFLNGSSAPNPDYLCEITSTGDNGGLTVTVDDRNIPVSTPNGLPGIPVTSGGNYTDSNGQQWVSDEIDLARGVYVQRITRKVFDGTETIAQNGGNASQFYYNHGLTAKSYQPCLCNALVGSPKGGNSGDPNTVSVSGTYIWFCHPSFSQGSDVLKNYMAEKYATGTPVVVLFQLAVPIETPLTESELAAFAALDPVKQNSVISNDENAWMTAEYAADTKAYIDKKFEELAKVIVSNT